MLILAFDTATDLATSALVADGATLGEATGRAQSLLHEIDALLEKAGAVPADLDALVVGIGPGSFTGTRVGLALARGLGLSLGIPVAGVSTLDALASAAPEAFPVVDARRGEVFVTGPRALAPDAVSLPDGCLCVGDGAVRYRALFEREGAEIPPDDSELHVARAALHAAIATSFGPADEVRPLYVRAPDADRWLAA